MKFVKNFQHEFKDAFRLMKYATEDQSIVEWVWNSRDGVTPFCISTRDGRGFMNHVQWKFDVYIPSMSLFLVSGSLWTGLLKGG